VEADKGKEKNANFSCEICTERERERLSKKKGKRVPFINVQ